METLTWQNCNIPWRRISSFDIEFWSYTPSWKGWEVPYVCGARASLVSAGMKAQTPKWISFAGLFRKLEIQAAPLTSRDHYSWTICRKRVCKYPLEMYQSYLQLWCRMFLLNLYNLRSAASFASTSHLGRIPPKRVKRNWNMCHLKFSPNLKRSWAITHFWPNCSFSSIYEQNLTLALEPNLFPGLYWILCFDPDSKLRYNFGFATRVSHVRISWETWEGTYNFRFQCLLGFHFEDGQDFELPKSLHCVQNQILAAWSNSKTCNS
jgi:hypothetical protein